jgi:hypothetical protein
MPGVNDEYISWKFELDTGGGFPITSSALDLFIRASAHAGTWGIFGKDSGTPC